jgi:GxxExxY protein
MTQMASAKRDPQTFAVIGAAMEVHSQLGSGFLESVYHEAFAIELGARNIPFQRETTIVVHYKSRPLSGTFKSDFICYGEVLIEIKAVKKLGAAERAQIINYLRATEIRRGLLLNFGEGKLEYERFVVGPEPSVPSVLSVVNLEIPEPIFDHLIDAIDSRESDHP